MTINRFVFLGSLLIAFIISTYFIYEKWNKNKPFTIGVIADCQYCNDPGTGTRKYAASEQKLKQCVERFNEMDLEFVVHLGDFIDRDFSSFSVVGPIFNSLNTKGYHVLGNHDFSVENSKKEKVPAILKMPSRYYDFTVRGWRFIVLDGNDISFYAYPEKSVQFTKASDYYETNQIESPKWNGAIGETQLQWLADILQSASKANEKVILFSHFPVYPKNVHNLWNDAEVIRLIEKYSCVKAFMNGHNHAGNYDSKEGIHYLTFQGMVDTEETSFATMRVSKQQLVITGYGRETDRKLIIR